MYGRYQLTSYEKFLILLNLGVSQVRAAVRINVTAKPFLRDVTPNKWAAKCESHFHLFSLTQNF